MSTPNKTLFAQLKEGSSPSNVPRSGWSSPTIRWVLIVCAIVATAITLPRSGVDTQLDGYDRTLLGSIWSQETIRAEYAFPVQKSQARLSADRERARAQQPLVFSPVSGPNLPLNIQLDNATTTLDAEARKWIRDNLGDIQEALTSKPVIDRDLSTIPHSVVLMSDGESTTLVNTSDLQDTALIRKWMISRTTQAPKPHQKSVRNALLSVVRATHVYNEPASVEAAETAAMSVPTTSEIVRSGDIIVANGQHLDERALLRLASYRNAQHLRSATSFSYTMIVGGLLHAMMIVGFLVLYLRALRPASYYRNGQLGTLLLLPIVSAGLSWLSLHVSALLPFEYLIVVPAFAMIVTILYDARTALAVTVAMALSAGAARGDDYGITFVLLFGGAMGIYGTRNLQGRTQIFTSIVSVFIGIVSSILAIELLRQTSLDILWPKLLVGTANAVLSPLLTFATIIVFEKVFNVATDIRLEEFDRTNHELLKTLNERAPGTYQHTMAVARLAEGAANAIGANAVLTRVGAYFHDIGKMAKSEYFVENQIGIGNKHDHLPPKKSASIIRQHVIDGIELAKEHGLPERVWKFIPMHHGTILIKHFYANAIKEAENNDAVVDPKDFRYTGPKPDSKETAIVMLADAVEALSRLEDTNSRSAVETAVESIIVERVIDGQLVNTPLTLQDLDLIKESFVKSIIGMSHSRVRYNTAPEKEATTKQ